MQTLATASVALLLLAVPAMAATKCRTGDFALSDARDVAAVRGAIERACPCADFDGSGRTTNHAAYVRCASAVVADAADGSPVLGAFSLRRECRNELKKIAKTAACGYATPRAT